MTTINPYLVFAMFFICTLSAIVNIILLSLIKSGIESFIVELKKILATPAPKKPEPAHHIVGMFIQNLFSEILNKKTQPDGQGISGVYTMNDLEHVPTQVLREALKMAEKNEQFEDAEKFKAELDKRGAAN